MSTVKTEKRSDPFKPVIRKRDMDKDMYNYIERMAKECVENPKEKFKDENVIIIYNNIYIGNSKLH